VKELLETLFFDYLILRIQDEGEGGEEAILEKMNDFNDGQRVKGMVCFIDTVQPNSEIDHNLDDNLRIIKDRPFHKMGDRKQQIYFKKV